MPGKGPNRTMNWLHRVEDAGRILAIVAMTVIVFYQVVARILFKWSSPALEEAARFIMIWSIFIGAVVTTREDEHIKMGGLVRSDAGRLHFELLSKVITLAFFVIFDKWAFDFALYSWRKGMNSIVLGVPLTVVHVCFFVTGVLMTFHTLLHLIDCLRKVRDFHRGRRP